jgi:hypothetical protein
MERTGNVLRSLSWQDLVLKSDLMHRSTSLEFKRNSRVTQQCTLTRVRNNAIQTKVSSSFVKQSLFTRKAWEMTPMMMTMTSFLVLIQWRDRN